MKITTTTTILDGTAEELAAYHAQINASSSVLQVSSEAIAPAVDALEHFEATKKPVKFVKVEVARRVISRRPLSKEQKIVLVGLYKAHPDKLSTSALQEATGYSARQLAGLMGAFGRRLTHTPGYEDGDNMFDWVWADDGWHYGLPSSVRTAMELEKLS
jgi:hypothetical protein